MQLFSLRRTTYNRATIAAAAAVAAAAPISASLSTRRANNVPHAHTRTRSITIIHPVPFGVHWILQSLLVYFIRLLNRSVAVVMLVAPAAAAIKRIYLIRYKAKCNNCVPKCTIYWWHFGWISDAIVDAPMPMPVKCISSIRLLCCNIIHKYFHFHFFKLRRTHTPKVVLVEIWMRKRDDIVWCKAVVKHSTKYSCRRIYANLLSQCVNICAFRITWNGTSLAVRLTTLTEWQCDRTTEWQSDNGCKRWYGIRSYDL